MRKKLHTSLLFIFFLTPLLGMEPLIEESPVLLLTYPRSGNTWLRYCIEYLTKRPTGETRYLFPTVKMSIMNAPLSNSFDLGADLSAPPIVKLHDYDHKKPSLNCPFLIMIVRNYKECLVREIKTEEKIREHLERRRILYVANLETYDNWDPEKRLLIYYEDLIKNPKETLNKVVNFFHADPQYLDEFMDGYDQHRANCIMIYERDEEPSKTKGERPIFHSNRLRPEFKRYMDKAIKRNNPRIFDLYLRRYCPDMS